MEADGEPRCDSECLLIGTREPGRVHLQAVGDLLIHERGSHVDMLEGHRDRWVRGTEREYTL